MNLETPKYIGNRQRLYRAAWRNSKWKSNFRSARWNIPVRKNRRAGIDPDQPCWTLRTADKIIPIRKAVLSDEGKKFDAAFKQEAVKKVFERGKGVSAVAEELGIHIKTMYRWLEESKQDGANAFPGKGKLKPDDEEMRRLKRENEDLREENEILKKVAVIFARHPK